MVLEVHREELRLKSGCRLRWLLVGGCSMVGSDLLQQVSCTVFIRPVSKFSEKELRLFYNRGKNILKSTLHLAQSDSA